MNNKRNMNGLFKAAFILLLVCVALLIIAVIVAYLFERPKVSAIFSVSGFLCAFVGIILAMFSKPKKEKNYSENLQEIEKNPVDSQ